MQEAPQLFIPITVVIHTPVPTQATLRAFSLQLILDVFPSLMGRVLEPGDFRGT